jgi:thioredoxin 1
VGEKARVVKVNVDEAQRAATELGIRAIPTVIVFKDGKAEHRFVGMTPENVLISAIEEAQ